MARSLGTGLDWSAADAELDRVEALWGGPPAPASKPAPGAWTPGFTVAHLDHTPENCDPANLRAMCQGCHLHYDRDHHAQTRRATRARELAAAGIDPLPGLEQA